MTEILTLQQRALFLQEDTDLTEHERRELAERTDISDTSEIVTLLKGQYREFLRFLLKNHGDVLLPRYGKPKFVSPAMPEVRYSTEYTYDPDTLAKIRRLERKVGSLRRESACADAAIAASAAGNAALFAIPVIGWLTLPHTIGKNAMRYSDARAAEEYAGNFEREANQLRNRKHEELERRKGEAMKKVKDLHQSLIKAAEAEYAEKLRVRSDFVERTQFPVLNDVPAGGKDWRNYRFAPCPAWQEVFSALTVNPAILTRILQFSMPQIVVSPWRSLIEDHPKDDSSGQINLGGGHLFPSRIMRGTTPLERDELNKAVMSRSLASKPRWTVTVVDLDPATHSCGEISQDEDLFVRDIIDPGDQFTVGEARLLDSFYRARMGDSSWMIEGAVYLFGGETHLVPQLHRRLSQAFDHHVQGLLRWFCGAPHRRYAFDTEHNFRSVTRRKGFFSRKTLPPVQRLYKKVASLPSARVLGYNEIIEGEISAI